MLRLLNSAIKKTSELRAAVLSCQVVVAYRIAAAATSPSNFVTRRGTWMMPADHDLGYCSERLRAALYTTLCHEASTWYSLVFRYKTDLQPFELECTEREKGSTRFIAHYSEYSLEKQLHSLLIYARTRVYVLHCFAAERITRNQM
jgi:hypothetical protein